MKPTPKEKAKKLIIEFTFQREEHELYVAKTSALICVNEILEATIKHVAIREKTNNTVTGYENVVHSVYDEYWKQVKNEIEKL